MSLIDKTIPVDFSYTPYSYWPEQFSEKEIVAYLQQQTSHKLPGNINWQNVLCLKQSPEVQAEIEEQHRFHDRYIACTPAGEDSNYLPELELNEVEIARINFHSVLGDRYSIRARYNDQGHIDYRIVDEYQGEHEIKQLFCEKDHLLTLAELIELINGTNIDGMLYEGSGLVESFWDVQLYEGDATPEDAVAFVDVYSDFYPGLANYFDEYGERWVENQRQDAGDYEE